MTVPPGQAPGIYLNDLVLEGDNEGDAHARVIAMLDDALKNIEE